jgi:PAS domain-containing protein
VTSTPPAAQDGFGAVPSAFVLVTTVGLKLEVLVVGRPDPLSPILPDWQTAGLIVALLLIVAGTAVGQRMRTRIRRLASALDYMSQGLCMFDGSSRIVFCNKPFLRMYNLSASVAKPGCTRRALLEHRKHTGLLSLDVEQYYNEIMEGVAAGRTLKWTLPAGNGRTFYSTTSRHLTAGGSRPMRT